MQVTIEHARKVIEIVDKGLSKGLGVQEPGKMCVEAAVCAALGLPHGDDPQCVASSVRAFKIQLNDLGWSSNAARAVGLRRLAVAQLGSLGVVNDRDFIKLLALKTIQAIVPIALRAAANIPGNKTHKEKLEKAAIGCENAMLPAGRDALALARVRHGFHV